MATRNHGPIYWTPASRDADGHRTYEITFRVVSDEGPVGQMMDGPAAVLATPGLPQPGDPWNFFGDSDPAVICTYEAEIKVVEREEPYVYFDITFTFTSRPFNFCQGGTRDEPTTWPAEIDIATTAVRHEAGEDAYGFPIVSSSHEVMTGAAVDRERKLVVVTVKKNIPWSQFDLPRYVRNLDTTNSAEMWGLGYDKVRFADFSATRKFTARCEIYWEGTFRFEVDREGWAKEVVDEGTMVLRGRWVRQPTGGYVYVVDDGVVASNPNDFDKFSTPSGQQARVMLNGAGLPAGVIVGRNGLFIYVGAGGAGHPLTDQSHWLPVRGGYDEVIYQASRTGAGTGNLAVMAFDVNSRVRKGHLALSDDLATAYVAIDDEPAGLPPITAGWLALPQVVIPVVGRYNQATVYAVGDVVDGSRQETTQGYIRVVHYSPVNLPQLLADIIPPDLNLE
jgi:hypothetical protein